MNERAKKVADSLARLDWAESKIQRLANDVGGWIDSNIETFMDHEEVPGYIVFKVKVKEDVPISIRAESAGIANHIRASLDALAYAIALPESGKKVYFPIKDKQSDFAKASVQRELLSIFEKKDLDKIMSFQPFFEAEDGSKGNLPLYALHHYDIGAKHHSLSIKNIAGDIGIIATNEGPIIGFQVIWKNLDIPGTTTVGKIRADSAGIVEYEPVIRFTSPDIIGGKPLLEVLEEFLHAARAVVSAF